MTNPKTSLRLPNFDAGLWLALLLPLFAVMPLLTHAGLPNTADGPAHLMRQVELNQAWQEGNFYPRWGTDLAFGHGMPIFSYAPPALYQLTQFFHLFGLPLDAAMKAVLILDFGLYSLGMFLLARRLFGSGPAILAAGLYVYAPYRLREAYIQGNYGQFTGLAFYPFIFWAFHGLVTTRRPIYLVAAALSLAGLLLSHNISFMLFAPMLAAYLLFLLIITTHQTHKRIRESLVPSTQDTPPASHAPRFVLHTLAVIAAAGLLGLGVAAIFWLPAFGERHEIQLEGITRGFFDFRANFIALSELFALPLPLDLAAINPEFPLSLGVPQIIGAGLSFIALLLMVSFRKKFPANRESVVSRQSQGVIEPNQSLITNIQFPLFFAFFLLLYTFLATPHSQTLWEAVPLLELAEFPWRMLGPAIFCASLLGGFAWAVVNQFLSNINLTAHRFVLISNFLFLVSIFAIIALNAYYLYPSQFIVWKTPSPADAFHYEVISGAIGTTSTGEFLPRAAEQHPQPDILWPDYAANHPPQKLDPSTLPPDAHVEILYHHAESDALRIDTPTAFTASLRTLYWPGWQLYLNGQPQPFTVTAPTGLIQTFIPPGQHTLTLQLESTPLRTTGLWLTISSFLILVLISLISLKQRLTSNIQYSTVNVKSLSPLQLTPHLFLLTTALLIIGYLLSRPLAPLFTLQSNPDQPQPADHHLQVDFVSPENRQPQLRLVGLDSLPTALSLAGERQLQLDTTLYWRALQKLETNYSIFLHLDTPNGQTLATIDEVHPENIPTRNWPPGLYLRQPLHLEIPATLPPIQYAVNVGVYERQSATRLLVAPGDATIFTLGSLWLTPPQPTVPSTPLARFGPDIILWDGRYDYGTAGSLVLHWQTTQALPHDYSIFVHLLDASGHILAQADGPPYDGLYPLRNWQPGQIITESRPLVTPNGLATIALWRL
ncbi:MAG: 6-pyruvoyl-tetrahydropterin synthase-related protein [Anaerolineae bacterium]